jgi:hypothetical protein
MFQTKTSNKKRDTFMLITHFFVTFTVYGLIHMWSQRARIAVLCVHLLLIFLTLHSR